MPDFKNMKSDELLKYVEKKTESAQNYSIDLKQIKNMSSEKLKEIKSKIINQLNIQMNSDDSKSIEEKIENNSNIDKSTILDLIARLKGQTSNDILEKTEIKIKPIIEKKTKNKNINMSEDISDALINSDDEDNNTKTINIISDSKESQIPEYYNDYMITFDEIKSNKIFSFEMQNLKFSGSNTIITENNNKFTIITKEYEQKIEFEEGEYTIDEMLELIQSSFDENSLNLSIILNKKNKVIIENNTGDNFEIKNKKKSVLRLLGFTDEYYEGSHRYESNMVHALNNTIYMYIYYGISTNEGSNQKNVFGDEPFAEINFNKIKNVYKKNLINPINVPLDCLFIKFKNQKTEENDAEVLYNFVEISHKFNMLIKIKESNHKSPQRSSVI